MQRFKVTGGTFKAGKGTLLGLSEGQAARRAGRVTDMGEGVYRAEDVLDFKNGEELKIAEADIAKSMRGIMVCLDLPAEAVRPVKRAKG